MWWRDGQPRRNAIHTVQVLQAALDSANAETTLKTILLPASIQGRTSAEQAEFIRKALQDELTPGGIDLLKKQAAFGPLREMFPLDAEKWARQAGVNVQDCVAFRLEKGGVRIEVVLVKQGESYRVVRCNNVKQVAVAKL